MTKPHLRCLMLTWFALLATTLGCGEPPLPEVNFDDQAKAKVDSFKRLADAMQKDANGLDARAALEDFRITALDVTKNPQEGREILEIYRTRIMGKYQGEVPKEVSLEIAPIETLLKQAK